MKQPFYPRFSLLILAVALFLLPLVGMGALRAMRTNNNDVRKWLPEGYKETEEYAWFQQAFGSEEFILASWDGATFDDQRLDVLAEKLKTSDAGLLASVTTGKELLRRLVDEPLELPLAEAVRRLEGLVLAKEGSPRLTCLLITLTPEGKRQLDASLALIRNTAIKESGIAADSLRLGGPPVINKAIDVEGARSLSRLAGFSGIVGLVIAWWCFRNLKLTFIVFATALYAAALSLSIVYFTGTPMNAILLMMPPLVYVAAASGAIHLTNYYRDALDEHGPVKAPGKAIRHGWVPLCLATGTTSVGLLSLCYSDLVPIRQFGVYSAIGVAASLSLLLLFLPAALAMFPPGRKSEAGEHEPPAMRSSPHWLRRIGNGAITYHGWVTAAGMLLLAVGLYGTTMLQTTVKVEKFFSPQAQVKQDYRWLESNLGPLVPMEVVLRFDETKNEQSMLERMELVEELETAVRSLDPEGTGHHLVGSTISAVTFAPDLDVSGSRRPWLQRSLLEKRLPNHRESFVNSGYLETVTNPGPDAVAGTSDDYQEELWRISLRVEALNEVDYGFFVQEIQNAIEPVIAAKAVEDVHGISATYTGMVPLVFKAQRSLLEGVLFGFVTDTALIVVAVIILVRHWSAGMLLFFTSIFPAVLVFGYMGLMGIIVDVGTVMTPGVALGVTVDDVIHFLLWFRKGVAKGMDRRQAVMLAYRGCGRAMYQSWGVLGLGLAVFGLSAFVPTQRFGFLMVSLLTVGLVGNLLFLPALLSGPLGAVFARGVQPKPTGDTGDFERTDTAEGTGRETHGKRRRRKASRTEGVPSSSATPSA